MKSHNKCISWAHPKTWNLLLRLCISNNQ